MKPFATAAYSRILVILAVSMMVGAKKHRESRVRSRKLQDDADDNMGVSMTVNFQVPLFLELQYLNETVVDLLENHHDDSTQPVEVLCRCLKDQVRNLSCRCTHIHGLSMPSDQSIVYPI